MIEIADQHHVLVFTLDTGQRAGSQLSVLACCKVEAAHSYSIDILAGNICHCIPSQFLSSSPSLAHTNLFPFPVPQPPVSSLHFAIFPSHQPSAAVRGYHSSNAATTSPSLGSSWIFDSSAGQGPRSGSSFARANVQHYLSHHQQHLHHPPEPTHTGYTYCTAHTAVSRAYIFFIDAT